MADAVAAFYSQPSGQQRGGGKGLGVAKKFAIPLWRNVKDKLCEKIPSVAGKLCDRQVSKISQGVRQMGERQLEVGESISASRPAKRKLPKKKRKKVKKIRFTSDDEDDDEPRRTAKRKRPRSQIAQSLGPYTY